MVRKNLSNVCIITELAMCMVFTLLAHSSLCVVFRVSNESVSAAFLSFCFDTIMQPPAELYGVKSTEPKW